MKPVAWQYKCKASREWVCPGWQDKDYRSALERAGHETRDLYAIPEGYVLVPVEPTKEMQHAVMNKFAACDECINPFEAYRTMISFVQEESE